MKTFYDKALIELAEPKLLHDQWAQTRDIPQNGGKTIEFRQFDNLPKALTPITEGVTPTGNKLVAHSLTAQVDQYGDYIELTDLIRTTTIDPIVTEATKKLASQASVTLDTVTREVLHGGAAYNYCPKDNGDGTFTKIESRKDITAACRLTVKEVFKAAAELKAVDAPKIGDAYIAIIHPYIAYDLMQDAKGQWLDIQKYTNVDKIYNGEIGMLGGVRFVESTEAKIVAPAVISDGKNRLTVKTALESSGTSLTVNEVLTAGTYSGDKKIPVYVNGTANYITAIANNTTYSTLTLENSVTTTDGAKGNIVCGQGAGKDGSAVFPVLFLAEDAYATTKLAGGGLEHIVKPLGYGNDPLNQRSSVGWKATKVAKRLIDQYILHLDCGCSEFSATANSN